MYYNKYQEYIKELIDEYGPLLKRQILAMVNANFETKFENIDTYIRQMCIFGDFEIQVKSKNQIFGYKGEEPNFDIIRSFDVMIEFLPNVKLHRRCKEMFTISYFVENENQLKEISVIPVKSGLEWAAATYADDKIKDIKCEIVIFLIEDKKQIKLINTECNARFAILDEKGVVFYTRN